MSESSSTSTTSSFILSTSLEVACVSVHEGCNIRLIVVFIKQQSDVLNLCETLLFTQRTGPLVNPSGFIVGKKPWSGLKLAAHRVVSSQLISCCSLPPSSHPPGPQPTAARTDPNIHLSNPSTFYFLPNFTSHTFVLVAAAFLIPIPSEI